MHLSSITDPHSRFGLVSGLAMLTGLTILSPNPAAAQNWPQFRGPGGTGLTDVRTLPAEWSDKVNLAWKVAMPGDAWSSPIVWGDRLFVTTAVPEEKMEDFFRWEVHCLDPATGKTRWKQIAAEGKGPIPIHNNNTYASETPATDGKRLYAYFGMKGLFCYDMSTASRSGPRTSAPSRRVDDMGTASSPALADGRLFILCENDKNRSWPRSRRRPAKNCGVKPRPSKSSWSTPVCLAQSAAHGTRGLRQRHGSVVRPGHRQAALGDPGLQGKFTATPVGNDELLMIGSAGAFDEGPLFAVRTGASGRIDLPAGKEGNDGIAWSRTRSGSGHRFRLADRRPNLTCSIAAT